jgi:hypothetical protein
MGGPAPDAAGRAHWDHRGGLPGALWHGAEKPALFHYRATGLYSQGLLRRGVYPRIVGAFCAVHPSRSLRRKVHAQDALSGGRGLGEGVSSSRQATPPPDYRRACRQVPRPPTVLGYTLRRAIRVKPGSPGSCVIAAFGLSLQHDSDPLDAVSIGADLGLGPATGALQSSTPVSYRSLLSSTWPSAHAGLRRIRPVDLDSGLTLLHGAGAPDKETVG